MTKYSASPDWWLPGFICGVGSVAPGTALGYPNNSCVATSTGIATNFFSNYRYVIKPESQVICFDANGDGVFTSDELQASMPLAKTNEDDAPLYHFPIFAGVGIY